jgi:glycosyltransferase involved in cell wall biosynthesis
LLKIAHFTTVHKRSDVRIRYKQSISSSKHGDVVLVVADGMGSEGHQALNIVDLGYSSKKLINRVVFLYPRLIIYALTNNINIAHIHDPELIPFGWFLKLINKKVIYDAHEDYPKQILHKDKFPFFVRKPISLFIKMIEIISSRYIFDIITVPSNHMLKRFEDYKKNVYELYNYPLLSEFRRFKNISVEQRFNSIVYVGPIFRLRGIKEIITSLEYVQSPIVFDLAGAIADQSYFEELKRLPGWRFVRYHGILNRNQVCTLLQNSKIGVVADYPVEHYMEAYSTKMFEYMASGLALLLTDMPLHKNFLLNKDCGYVYKLFDKFDLANKIDIIVNNDVIFSRLSDASYNFSTDYSWESQEYVMSRIYGQLTVN